MPSFAISKFTVLLEPLWVSAEFLLLSTDPNLDGTLRPIFEAKAFCGTHLPAQLVVYKSNNDKKAGKTLPAFLLESI